MRIIKFILKNKRAIATELCFLAIFLLLPMLYIYNLRCNHYDKMIDYKERVDGKIVRFKQPEISSVKLSFSLADIENLSFEPAPTPPVTGIKDGDIVWVSGVLESKDSLNIPLRDSDGKVVSSKNLKALNACYLEMNVKERRLHEIENITYVKYFTADAAKIGAMPIDAELLSSHIEPSTLTDEHNYYSWGHYRTRILATPDTAISCIGRYKDGKLTITEKGDPFIYSLQEGVEPEDLIDNEVNRRKAQVESMESMLKYVSMVLAVLVAVLLLSRKRSDKSKRFGAYEDVCRELARLNLMRYAVFAISTIPFLGVLYIWCKIGEQRYAEELSLWAFPNTITVCFLIHLAIEFVLGWYSIKRPYKQDILNNALSENGDIRQLYNIPFNTSILCELGSSALKSSDTYNSDVHFGFEDSYALSINNGSRTRELTFFEAYVRKENKMFGDSKALMEALCMIMPIDAGENVRLNIEPIGHLSSSNLKIRYREDLNNEAYPENMNIYTNRTPETDVFLTDTPFLENVQMIIDIVKERFNEDYPVFSVYKNNLYVFVYTSRNRFEVSLYSSINYGTIRHDIDTADAFREIGKKWKD